MFQRLGNALLVFAVLTATGTDWLILQSIAWTGMLADNLQKVPLCQAVDRTFDGQHPCCLCKAIAKGKKAEKKSQFSFQFKRLEFVRTVHEFALNAPAGFWLLSAVNVFAEPSGRAPPVPPPRASFA